MILKKGVLILLVMTNFLQLASAQLYVDERGNASVGVEESPDARMYIENMEETTTLKLTTNITSNQDVYGIYNEVIASGSGITTGIHSEVVGEPSATKIGIYSRVLGGEGLAGLFWGDVFITGEIVRGGLTSSETSRQITDALNLVQGLSPKHQIGVNGKGHYGFVAEEVEHILPSLVKTTMNPSTASNTNLSGKMLTSNNNTDAEEETINKAINYDELIPILTQAIKEQQELIEQLTQRIQKMEEKVE